MRAAGAGEAATLPAGLEEALGRGPAVRVRELSGGMIGRVRRVAFADGSGAVVKTSAGLDLRVEALMLRALRGRLPVPEVWWASRDALALEPLPGSAGACGPGAERHAGELLAALHAPPEPAFGFERDTLLGPFPLPNPETRDWPSFFAEARLRRFASHARDSGRLPEELHAGVMRLADRVDGGFLLDHEPAPALLHNDVWSGNVLCEGERVTGFLDPAVYRGDREVDLAYIALFRTFGRPFWDAYDAVHPPREGAERRRDVYQLVPLLVHVALFGGGYAAGVEERLARLSRS